MENSTPAQAPEATPAPAAESQANQALSPPETKDTRRSSAADRLKSFLAEKAEAKKAERSQISDEPKPAVDTAAKIEKTAAKIEKAGGEVDDQKPGESDAKYEIRLAKQLRELRQEKERASKFEATATEASAKAQKLEKLIESGKANPLSILEHLGYSFADVVKGINEDRFKAPEKRLELPPEIAERLERLDRAEKEREQQALAARAQAEQAQHAKQVTEYVQANLDDFPLSSSMQGFAETIVQEAYKRKATDIVPLLEQMETNLANELIPMVSSEATIKTLLKKEPALREKLLRALGVETAAPAPAAKASGKSLDGLSTEPGTPDKKLTKEQRQALAVAKLRAARKE